MLHAICPGFSFLLSIFPLFINQSKVFNYPQTRVLFRCYLYTHKHISPEAERPQNALNALKP